MQIPCIISEDRGPNGADGKATFNPPLSVSLIVTLYRVCSTCNVMHGGMNLKGNLVDDEGSLCR